jgi:glutamate-1-semialdehyde 2,1-aminomutase
VYQAGTLSGNPLAVAAGLATIEQAHRRSAVRAARAIGARLEAGVVSALGTRRACVQRVGSLSTLFFGPSRFANYEDALGSDTDTFAKFFRGMADRGVWLPPSQFEAWFVSAAHTDADVDRTIAAVGDALSSVD